jgi:hypothetical protein
MYTGRGVLENRMTFPEINAPLQTDETFSSRQDEDHHIDKSLLSKLNGGMVSSFQLTTYISPV